MSKLKQQTLTHRASSRVLFTDDLFKMRIACASLCCASNVRRIYAPFQRRLPRKRNCRSIFGDLKATCLIIIIALEKKKTKNWDYSFFVKWFSNTDIQECNLDAADFVYCHVSWATSEKHVFIQTKICRNKQGQVLAECEREHERTRWREKAVKME